MYRQIIVIISIFFPCDLLGSLIDAITSLAPLWLVGMGYILWNAAVWSIFPHYAFSNVSSNCLNQRMHNFTGFICSTFLHCAFSNESSNGLHEKRHSHIGCICLTFLHCAFSNVSSSCFSQRMHTHIGCICLIFLLHYLCSSRAYLHWSHFH